MNDIAKTDLKVKITEMLVSGKTPVKIHNALNCDPLLVLDVLSSDDFSSNALKSLDNLIRSFSYVALHNVSNIAFDDSASQATRLKASMFLVEKGKEINALGKGNVSPSTMTQDQLVESLEQLQRERDNRMKHMRSDDIEQTIDDLL